MTAHDVTGAETLRHLERLADLHGQPRTDYLAEIEHAHGREYRQAVAREDMRRREAIENTVRAKA